MQGEVPNKMQISLNHQAWTGQTTAATAAVVVAAAIETCSTAYWISIKNQLYLLNGPESPRAVLLYLVTSPCWGFFPSSFGGFVCPGANQLSGRLNTQGPSPQTGRVLV